MENEIVKKYIRFCLEYGLKEASNWEYSKDNPSENADIEEDAVEFNILYVESKEQFMSKVLEIKNDYSEENFEYEGEGYYDFWSTVNGEYCNKLDTIMKLYDNVEHKREVSDDLVNKYLQNICNEYEVHILLRYREEENNEEGLNENCADDKDAEEFLIKYFSDNGIILEGNELGVWDSEENDDGGYSDWTSCVIYSTLSKNELNSMFDKIKDDIAHCESLEIW